MELHERKKKTELERKRKCAKWREKKRVGTQDCRGGGKEKGGSQIDREIVRREDGRRDAKDR